MRVGRAGLVALAVGLSLALRTDGQECDRASLGEPEWGGVDAMMFLPRPQPVPVGGNGIPFCGNGKVVEGVELYTCVAEGTGTRWEPAWDSRCVAEPVLATCTRASFAVQGLPAGVELLFSDEPEDPVAQGSTVEVVCPAPSLYSLPDNTATCMGFDEWSSPLGTCEMPPSCSKESFVGSEDEGRFSLLWSSTADPVLKDATVSVLSCADSTHTYDGADSATCQGSDTWSAPIGTCTPPPRCSSASFPAEVAGGSLRFTDAAAAKPVGTVATVECAQGFELSGAQAELTCTGEDQWSLSAFPTCEQIPTCSRADLGAPDERMLWAALEDSVLRDTAVEVAPCPDGLTLGGPTSYTCGADGQWSPSASFASTCTAGCVILHSANGTQVELCGDEGIDLAPYQIEDEVVKITFRCESGCKAIFTENAMQNGTSESFADPDIQGLEFDLDTLTGSASSAIVTPITCVNSELSSQVAGLSFPTAPETAVGASASLLCPADQAVETPGTETVECGRDGTWPALAVAPVCVDVCSADSLAITIAAGDGSVVAAAGWPLRVGDTVTIQCVGDYELTGPSEYSCTGAGVWNAAFESACSPPQCTWEASVPSAYIAAVMSEPAERALVRVSDRTDCADACADETAFVCSGFTHDSEDPNNCYLHGPLTGPVPIRLGAETTGYFRYRCQDEPALQPLATCSYELVKADLGAPSVTAPGSFIGFWVEANQVHCEAHCYSYAESSRPCLGYLFKALDITQRLSSSIRDNCFLYREAEEDALVQLDGLGDGGGWDYFAYRCVEPPPQDCVFELGDWGECSVSCGSGGTQSQPVTVASPAFFGGAECPDPAVRPCEASPACPVKTDCVTEWSQWTECEPECVRTKYESAFRRRNMAVVTKAQNGGLDCIMGEDKMTCHDPPVCPPDIDCVWAWTPWACSVQCGGGKRTRQAVISVAQSGRGAACSNTSAEEVDPVACNDRPCLDCEWHWEDLEPCSATCGPSTKRQTVNVTQDQDGGLACDFTASEQVVECPDLGACPAPIDCEWEWRNSTCSVSCAQGTLDKTAHVTVVAQHGGAACTLPNDELGLACDLGPCPIDCVWEWRNSTCTTTCGPGSLDKTTFVTVEAQYGGVACDLPADELGLACEVVPCPVHCEWEWRNSTCSTTCGPGTFDRTTHVLVDPLHGGDDCDRPPDELGLPCELVPCPIDCVWAWVEEGGCSATCGKDGTVALRATVTTEPAHGGAACDLPSETSQAACDSGVPCPCDFLPTFGNIDERKSLSTTRRSPLKLGAQGELSLPECRALCEAETTFECQALVWSPRGWCYLHPAIDTEIASYAVNSYEYRIYETHVRDPVTDLCVLPEHQVCKYVRQAGSFSAPVGRTAVRTPMLLKSCERRAVESNDAKVAYAFPATGCERSFCREACFVLSDDGHGMVQDPSGNYAFYLWTCQALKTNL